VTCSYWSLLRPLILMPPSTAEVGTTLFNPMLYRLMRGRMLEPDQSCAPVPQKTWGHCDRRHALVLLAKAGRRGEAHAALLVNGVARSLIRDLVESGHAMVITTGSYGFAINTRASRIRITAAGRRLLRESTTLEPPRDYVATGSFNLATNDRRRTCIRNGRFRLTKVKDVLLIELAHARTRPPMDPSLIAPLKSAAAGSRGRGESLRPARVSTT
jgi:hypothetical protein